MMKSSYTVYSFKSSNVQYVLIYTRVPTDICVRTVLCSTDICLYIPYFWKLRSASFHDGLALPIAMSMIPGIQNVLKTRSNLLTSQ